MIEWLRSTKVKLRDFVTHKMIICKNPTKVKLRAFVTHEMIICKSPTISYANMTPRAA